MVCNSPAPGKAPGLEFGRWRLPGLNVAWGLWDFWDVALVRPLICFFLGGGSKRPSEKKQVVSCLGVTLPIFGV